MAILSKSETNALRKALRLLALREHQGDATYDSQCEHVASQVREMLTPVERFQLHLPVESTIKSVLKVVWYETDAEGIKHLYLKEEPQDSTAGSAS